MLNESFKAGLYALRCTLKITVELLYGQRCLLWPFEQTQKIINSFDVCQHNLKANQAVNHSHTALKAQYVSFRRQVTFSKQ